MDHCNHPLAAPLSSCRPVLSPHLLTIQGVQSHPGLSIVPRLRHLFATELQEPLIAYVLVLAVTLLESPKIISLLNLGGMMSRFLSLDVQPSFPSP